MKTMLETGGTAAGMGTPDYNQTGNLLSSVSSAETQRFSPMSRIRVAVFAIIAVWL